MAIISASSLNGIRLDFLISETGITFTAIPSEWDRKLLFMLILQNPIIILQSIPCHLKINRHWWEKLPFPISNLWLNSAGVTEETDGEYIIYTVHNGDTIWDIVKMYDNVTATQVLNLNNISDPSKIKIGQKLKIKKKS